jgi:transcriptional regulator of acetoin/glycerol metabolism
MNRCECRLSPAAIDRLLAWDWPGNVRELENVLENALVRAPGACLDEELFLGLVGPEISRLTYAEARERVLTRFETDYLNLMLQESNQNVSEAARRMGLTRQGLQKMMKRRGIHRNQDGPSQAS